MGRCPTIPGAALCLVVAAVVPSVVAVAVSEPERPQEEAAAPTTLRSQRPVGTVDPTASAPRGLDLEFAGASHAASGRARLSAGPDRRRRPGREPVTGASARSLLAQAEPAAPAEPSYLGLLDDGLSLLRAGDYQAALKKFDAAGRLEPNPRVIYLKGVTLNRLGRYRQALVNLWLAEKAGETTTGLDLEIGRAAAGSGAWRLAVDRLERYDRESPGDAQVSVFLGRAYLGLGEYDIQAARPQTIEPDPEEPVDPGQPGPGRPFALEHR